MTAEEFSELKERYDFERGARWAAEENLAWIIAIETAWLVDLYNHRWWLAGIIGIATFFVIARIFGRREEAAEDAYYRAIGLGKYFELRRGDQP